METSAIQLPARWQLIAAITRKELAMVLYHPYHLISLLIPLFMSIVLLFLIPSLDSLDTIEIVLFDEGNSQLPAVLDAQPEVSVRLVGTETAVFEGLSEQATVGLIIPQGFDTAVASNRSPQLTVYLNSEARSSNIAEAKRLLVETIASLREPAPAAQITWTEQQPGETGPNSFSIESYLFTTMVLLSIAIVGTSILPQLLQEEREQGALLSLVATPVTLIDSMLGKLIASLLLTWLLVGFVLVIHRGWQGNRAITAVAILLCSFLVLGIGLLFGLMLDKKSRSKATGSVLILLLAMPSWFSVSPIDRLPDAVALILRLIPTQYFVTTLNFSLAGQSWQAASSSLIILGLSTAVVYLFVGWRLSQNNGAI